MLHRVNSTNDMLSIDLQEGDYRIILTGNIYGNEVQSNMNVYQNEDLIISIPYNYDISENHWKLKQSSKVEQKANSLQNISPQTISELKNIFDLSIDYIYYETLDIKNRNLLSSINFYNSILTTRIRANNNNSDCDCTVHPGFLVDKTFFNCQEDQYYSIADLKEAVDDYAENNQLDTSTLNLKNFVDTEVATDSIRFNDFYSYYVSKEDFRIFIDNSLTSTQGDCAWWCPLGCGSDHGCCGNYSGCCLYVHPICHIHDKMCIHWKPAWFCLPGCKPDKPQKQIAVISIY